MVTTVRWVFFTIVATGLSIMGQEAGLFEGLSGVKQVIVGGAIGLIAAAVGLTIVPPEES